MKRLMIVLIFLVATIGLFAGAEKDVKKSFNAGQGGTLTVDAARGSIQVKTGSGNDVDVQVLYRIKSGNEKKLEKVLEDYKLEMDQSGDDVTVTLDKRDGSWWDGSNKLQVKFRIRVPEKYNVKLNTSGGSISVDDLEGKVKAKTSGGSLNFGNIDGNITGKTSGGSVTVGDCNGDVDVHTSGGSLNLGAIMGDVDARTSGGSINVRAIAGNVVARTSGGSITAKLTKQPESDCELSTSGGTVTAYLAEGIGVHVDAKTSGGSVSTDFPVTVQGKISKKSLNADINGGGPRLTLRTSGGSIRIKEL